MKSFKFIVTLLLMSVFSVAKSQRSLIVADNYNKKKDETTLVIIPNGNIVFPGKWHKIAYNQSSKQHFFRNADSTLLIIAKAPQNRFDFYVKNNSDEEFSSAFYKWENDYWTQKGLNSKLFKDQSDQGYILWQLSGQKHSTTTFLLGAKNGYGYNLSTVSKTWDEEKQQQFLADIFLKN